VRAMRDDPPSPLRRLTQMASIATIAARRGTDPRKLAAYVQGDRSVRLNGLLPTTRIYVADVMALAQRL